MTMKYIIPLVLAALTSFLGTGVGAQQMTLVQWLASINIGTPQGFGSQGANTSVLTQNGNNNRADITQKTLLALSSAQYGNRVSLLQYGNGNQADILQNGSNNTATLTQTGNYNSMKLSQTGTGNTISWTQTGDNLTPLTLFGSPVIITQTGGGAAIIITQPSP